MKNGICKIATWQFRIPHMHVTALCVCAYRYFALQDAVSLLGCAVSRNGQDAVSLARREETNAGGATQVAHSRLEPRAGGAT